MTQPAIEVVADGADAPESATARRTLRLPLTLGSNGGLSTLPVDSSAELAQSVRVLLTTRPGVRLSTPEYGMRDLTGEVDVSPDEVADVIAEWEPRADVDVQVTYSPNHTVAAVRVAVRPEEV